ncbi:MAG: hypothetical protein ACYC06_07535 [Ilumatobacteraceae bacterium]
MGELRLEDAPIPSLRGLRDDRDRIIETIDRLLKAERDDAKKHDTDKHIRILRFIREHAKKSGL